jgi:ASC-1-like (ASCH) protein
MDIHTMRVQPDYFALLKAGDKKVEFRLFDKKRQRIRAGDKVCFVCQNDPTENFPAAVSDILHSTSFTDLLNQIPASLLGGISKEDQLSHLRSFYEASDEQIYGVIAIILK